MCLPRLSRKSIDHHRHRVAGVIDKELFTSRMVLAHRYRQLQCPTAIEIAVAAVAISIRMKTDIFVPEDLQRDMFALQLAVNMRPIRLSAAAVSRLRPCGLIQRRLKDSIADIVAQWPRKPSTLKPA